MAGTHHYGVEVTWTGNTGEGTATYRSYRRTSDVRAEGKPSIAASADPHFRGDAERWNPEEMLVAALSQCHLLAFLHEAAVGGVVVVDYSDAATGTLATEGNGGRMTEVTLRPVVTVAEAGDGRRLRRAARASARQLLHRRLGELPGHARAGRAGREPGREPGTEPGTESGTVSASSTRLLAPLLDAVAMPVLTRTFRRESA